MSRAAGTRTQKTQETQKTQSRPPLTLIPQHFGSLVFDHRTSRYMPFDHESTALLKRLTERTIDDVLADEPDAATARAVQAFFECFYERGFFSADGQFAGDVLGVVPPPNHLTGPLAVHLEIIGACNLTCTHCFAGELPRNENPLSVAEMDRLFAELAGMGCFRVGLTGGEPLMRKDLFDIIDAATGRGLHPCLTTNGLLLTEEIARNFGRRELAWLNVSLDGATAATNDAVRGAGTFERVLDKLDLLRRHARFTLAFTLMSTNAHEAEACARLARDVGADNAVFRPLYPVGVAKSHPKLMPTFGQYRESLAAVSGCLHPDEDVHAIDPFSPQARREVQAKVFTNNGCGAGNLIASVSVRGDVNPCSFLGSAYDADNIRRRYFADIWHHSDGFRAMRGLSTGESEGEFRGGCRARSLAAHGDIDRPDPWHDEYVQLGGGAAHPLANWEAGTWEAGA